MVILRLEEYFCHIKSFETGIGSTPPPVILLLNLVICKMAPDIKQLVHVFFFFSLKEQKDSKPQSILLVMGLASRKTTHAES